MILTQIKNLYKKTIYFESKIITEQNNRFKKEGLNRIKGENKLKLIQNSHKLVKNLMSSEHQVLFASISQKLKKKKLNILEIGTFDGFNSFLLSQLFPKSKILTIDLPKNDETFKNTYKRSEKKNFLNHLKIRNNFIKKSSNVKFMEINSIFLTFFKKKFDLVWIDGAHGYPFATIDIINSLRMLKKDGIILCDDVFINKLKKTDKYYYSNSTIETLIELEKSKCVRYSLFYKRLDKNHNHNPNKRKFIAYVKKI